MIFAFIPAVAALAHGHHRLKAKGFRSGLPAIGAAILLAIAFVMVSVGYTAGMQPEALMAVMMTPSYVFWLVGNFLAPKEGVAEVIEFTCPYCEFDLSFDVWKKDSVQPCKHCGEHVTVTTDQAVHEAARKQHQELCEQIDEPFDEVEAEKNNRIPQMSLSNLNPIGPMTPPVPPAENDQGDEEEIDD